MRTVQRLARSQVAHCATKGDPWPAVPGPWEVSPTVTALADGRFVVAWADGSQTGGDTSNSAVRGQIFDPREAAVQLQGSIDADDYVGTIWGDTVQSATSSPDLASYRNVEHATVTGYRDRNLTGNDEANTLTGNADNNVYDADGSGIEAAVHFATFTSHPAITHADFTVT